ncbi:MAG: hypothetical protein AAFV46_03005 [Cyanobacteria bacterium J06635_11]
MAYHSNSTISNALYEAASHGTEFLSQAFDAVDRQYPEASHDARAQAASTLTLTMAINNLSMVMAGQVDGSPLSVALLQVLDGDDG